MIDKEFLVAAKVMADIAGEISRSYFRRKVDISLKSAKSAVTEADLKIEKGLTEHLKITYPDHSILGEEYGSTKNNSEYLWVIDPIDGTTAFICGKPIFCTLIALLYKDEPILGIIDQPIIGERWIGEINKKTIFNGVEGAVINENPNFLRLNCTTPLMFSKEQQKVFELVQSKVAISSYGGDGYAYGLLASGYIDIILEADLKFYDVAALIPIIKGIGGKITDWSGDEINSKTFNGTVLATRNITIHQKVLEVIQLRQSLKE
jgi:inositol-phosphate phosphatase/L-galactose 1-phosphate phosphatase/histidinol-phosphatase